MKRTKYRKYQAPQLKEASLETEGVFCQSLRVLWKVDETENINSYDGTSKEEPTYLEF